MEIGECGKSGKTLIGVFKEIKYDLRVCGHNKHFIKTRPLIGLWGLNTLWAGLSGDFFSVLLCASSIQLG